MTREKVPLRSRAGVLREGLRRNSGATFLCTLVLLIVTVPFVRNLSGGDLIEEALLTLVLLSAVMAVGGRRRTLILGTGLVMPAVLGKWIDHLCPGYVPQTIIVFVVLVFIAFIVIHHLHFVLKAPRVNSEVLCAAISTFLMLGLFWTFAYVLVGGLDPAAFLITNGPPQRRFMAGFEAIYFSLCTLGGASFGDITPVSDIARMLTMLEAMVGMFYIAILIARLVSLYSAQPKSS